MSPERKREILHRLDSGSIWDRQPVWLQWVTGIVLFLWFVPPLVLMAIKAFAG